MTIFIISFSIYYSKPTLVKAESNISLTGGQLIDNRSLVPLRSIFEELGATVKWEQDSKKITAVKGTQEIILTIGSKHTSVNGKQVIIDVPAQVRNGRTLVPLRFVSEALGATVGWDNDLGIASIALGNKKIEVTIEQDVWLRNPILFKNNNGDFVSLTNLTKGKIVRIKKHDLIDSWVSVTVEIYGQHYTRDNLEKAWIKGRLGAISSKYFFFTSPYSWYNWSQNTWDDIKNQVVKIGMTSDMVWLSWGIPYDINKSTGSWGVSEQWIYGSDILNRTYLYFDNGILTAIQD